jgi:hypothetical protein
MRGSAPDILPGGSIPNELKAVHLDYLRPYAGMAFSAMLSMGSWRIVPSAGRSVTGDWSEA